MSVLFLIPIPPNSKYICKQAEQTNPKSFPALLLSFHNFGIIAPSADPQHTIPRGLGMDSNLGWEFTPPSFKKLMVKNITYDSDAKSWCGKYLLT
jgi:hypothetical protein